MRRKPPAPALPVAEHAATELVQTRLPPAAAEDLKTMSKARFVSVAALVRTMILERLGYLPSASTPTKDPK